jgi:hypothetical protein
MPLSRRGFLALCAGAGAALVAPRARAIGESSLFRIGQLRLGERWDPRPSALRRLLWEIEKRTSIATAREPKPVALGDDDLHETPFLYLAGDREFTLPGERELERLRQFITYGGFLLIDSAEGSTGGAFDRSVRQLLQASVLGRGHSTRIVPRDHVVYKAFYLLDAPVGRLAMSSTMDGVFRDGRLAVGYVQNDLGGAWERDNFGNYRYRCEPGGERQREMSFRLGINLAMYALTLDYKEDQVHVPFIMRRRRWRPDDGAIPAPGELGSERR